MELLNPEQGIGNQEIPHFILSEIKNLRSPVRMLPFPRIRIFESRSAVKVRQAVGVSWEMRRYSVKDDAYLVPVKVIYHPRKIFRRAVPGGRRVVACYLISPGAVKRMLGNADQLHMGISHIL